MEGDYGIARRLSRRPRVVVQKCRILKLRHPALPADHHSDVYRRLGQRLGWGASLNCNSLWPLGSCNGTSVNQLSGVVSRPSRSPQFSPLIAVVRECCTSHDRQCVYSGKHQSPGWTKPRAHQPCQGPYGLEIPQSRDNHFSFPSSLGLKTGKPAYSDV